MDIFEIILKGIHTIGYLGPPILFFASIYFLFNKWTSLFIYLFGFCINILLNVMIKSFIQEPRPAEDRRLFNLEILNKKRIGYDRYGMPSGHAESVFYSTVFILLTLKNKWIGMAYLLVALITSFQRVGYQNHTSSQVIVGGLIGAIMGGLFYYYTVKVLKGQLRAKMDDNAPYF